MCKFIWLFGFLYVFAIYTQDHNQKIGDSIIGQFEADNNYKGSLHRKIGIYAVEWKFIV